MLDALARFRVWAGVPRRRDTRRPSIELLDVLFSRGRAALIALYRGFEAGVTPAESVMVLKALGAICRAAEAQKVIAWDFNAVRPSDGRGKLLVSFDSDLDAKLRAAAAAEEQSLSDFVRMAVADRVSTIEKRGRRDRQAAAVTA